MTTLFLDLWELAQSPEGMRESPAETIRRLGIKCDAWEGQPIADQIKLTGCSNIPDPLPPYLRVSKYE